MVPGRPGTPAEGASRLRGQKGHGRRGYLAGRLPFIRISRRQVSGRRQRRNRARTFPGRAAVLDTTIVNVALPSIAQGIKASSDALEWVVSGYALNLRPLRRHAPPPDRSDRVS